uniref:Uncharacterized protein n=1 Tax=Anopheles culicifacies TaxID=139723 RepID=A0A182MAX3_9DIPT
MCGLGHIRSIDLQDAVAHAQLTGQGSDTAGYNLKKKTQQDEKLCLIGLLGWRMYFTSLISGSNKRLSVTLVITVSVNVDLVIVSVTVPSSVGAGGNIGMSGTAFCTVTVTEGPWSDLSTVTCRPPLIK